ncbi:hypothetical protein [Nocardiopsis lambiniae]|uniref:Integrase n=1 Tax=Nocardiopsis lambiniae TaxID=3075539 RepID=A0ABU2MB74_9ACTN|nr:hypothetical protein [Nocardiopsis sp. DSM 44743]MDT0329802.1 hypothetical protein [Nocardiopsis sp. DSM 44743]
MPFLIATEPGRVDRPNEDFAAVTARCAVVLDGVSGPLDGDGGCSHGVAWYVRRLGALLLAGADTGRPLRSALAEAITATTALHAGTCDTAHRDTPSATVAAVRMTGEGLEYLVLSDSVLLVADPRPVARAGKALRADGRHGAPHPAGRPTGDGRPAGRPTVADAPNVGDPVAVDGVGLVADTRLDALRADLLRRGEPAGAIRALRGVPGGFWTAGSDPRAADEALTGTAAAGPFALMTDGATRAVEVFGDLDWGQAFSLVSDKGPRALIERVRALEAADPEGGSHPRGKVRDDATVVFWEPEALVR